MRSHHPTAVMTAMRLLVVPGLLAVPGLSCQPHSLPRGKSVPLCQRELGLHESSLHLQLPSLAAASWLLAEPGLSCQSHSLQVGEWVRLCQRELGLYEGSLHLQLSSLAAGSCHLAVGSVWPFLPSPLSPKGRVGASLPVRTGLTRGLNAHAT